MFWYLNEYINKDKLVFKIVRDINTYENWELVETYILKNGKFITYKTYLCSIHLIPNRNVFKKLLEFFNRL